MAMDDRLASALRLAFYQTLREIGEIDLGDLPSVVSALEDELIVQLPNFLTRCIARHARKNSVRVNLIESNIGSFEMSNNRCLLTAGPDPGEASCLVVAARAVVTENDPPSITEVGLSEARQFQKLRLVVDKCLVDYQELLCIQSETLIVAGGRFIEEFLRARVIADLAKAHAEMYMLLRSPFARDIAKDLFLYAIDPKTGGSIIMDPDATSFALDKFHLHRSQSGHSPADLLATLLTSAFPAEETIAAKIVPGMKTQVVEAHKIPSGKRVGLAQHILYDKERFVLQPLVNHERIWIEAAYPLALRSTVERILKRERETFKVALEFDKKGSVLTQLSRMSRPNGIVSGKAQAIAQLFGMAVGAAIDHILLHPSNG